MTPETLVQHADEAAEAIRLLNHGAYRSIPAPLAYDLLGRLARLGFGLAQLAEQISAGLSRSLTDYDVYDLNRDPAASVAIAAEALIAASNRAQRLGYHLDEAQAAIHLQGYNLRSGEVTDQ